MFFSNMHENVFGLITQDLKLDASQVNWSRKHQYLRGVYLNDQSYSDSLQIPFKLAPGETQKSPQVLLAYALSKLAPGIWDLWPFNKTPTTSAVATWRRLRLLRHKGRPLYQCGFWNALCDVVSHEAYDLLTETIGSAGVFRNSNAFDAIWNLVQELGPQLYFRLDAGYQALPQTLVDRCGANVQRRLESCVKAIAATSAGFDVLVQSPFGLETHGVDAVILALPQRALQQIDIDAALLEYADRFKQLRDRAVEPVAACKIFMTFDASWWDDSKFGPFFLRQTEVSAAYTDLPMRQCYYFGRTEPQNPAVLMAAYADADAVQFWQGLADRNLPLWPNPAADAADAEQIGCTEAMVDAALRQLTFMHKDVVTPAPKGAIYCDWGRDPYGAGWHAWSSAIDSLGARASMRQPNPSRALYVCGEAYAERQGWVEGAINSAELVLRRLGVDRPAWVGENYVFEQEEGPPMANRVSELLIALGESRGLQRAFARNPDDVMRAFGLDAKEQAALRSGDLDKVKQLANDDATISFFIVKFEE